jgi:hypothetical protein
MVLVAGAALGVLAPSAGAAVNFDPAHPYPASAPWWSAVTDFNGDGIADIATASNSTNIVSALIGNGDGTLQAPHNTSAAPSNLNAIAAGDLNGDGKGDVAVAVNGNPGTVRVYLGNGDGTFGAGVPYTVGAFPQDVVITQIDSNSSPDIAVANQTSHNISVFLNDGSGNFTPAPGSPVVDPNGNDFLGLGAADFDGDGNTDLAAGGINGANPGVYFFKGTATGAFNAPVPLGGSGAQKPVAGDLNGDGRPDIAAARSGVGDVVIIRRTASGFEAPNTVDPDGPGGNNGRLALADLDGDGALDIAVPNFSGPQAEKVSILLGHGDATFEVSSHEPVGNDPRQVVSADLNRDGNPDLVTSNSGAGDVSVLLATPPSATITPSAIAFGDQAPNTPSAEQTVTVRNNGAPRLRPGGVDLVGVNPGEFSISSNTCTGANLGIGSTCTVGVKFTPNGLGGRTAGLRIASNAGGSPHIVALTGNGAPPAGPKPGPCANDQNGTAANDTLNGTDFGDNLFGFAGNDTLNGLGGDDCLTGGNGNDRLNGGEGKDTLEGNSGNDVEDGGNGNDKGSGGSGRDRMSGGAGNDSLNGQSGNDTVSGGTGNDRLSGSTGNDKINGGSGKNTYSGGPGKDTISAANGRVERIDCGSGRDSVRADRKDKVKHCEKVRRTRR